MGGENYVMDGSDNDQDLRYVYKPFDKPLDLGEAPKVDLPEHQPLALTPPAGVTEKELFAFPGVNWFEYFRDSVLKVAHDRLIEAQGIMKPLTVEPGWFDQADSIRTFFNNFKGDTLHNLSILEQALHGLQLALTDQAAKYQRLEDAVSESVNDLGVEFGRAATALQNPKPITTEMARPEKK